MEEPNDAYTTSVNLRDGHVHKEALSWCNTWWETYITSAGGDEACVRANRLE